MGKITEGQHRRAFDSTTVKLQQKIFPVFLKMFLALGRAALFLIDSIKPFYSPVGAICITSLTFNNSTFSPHSVFMCFVWISEQTAIISLYNIN